MAPGFTATTACNHWLLKGLYEPLGKAIGRRMIGRATNVFNSIHRTESGKFLRCEFMQKGSSCLVGSVRELYQEVEAGSNHPDTHPTHRSGRFSVVEPL